MEERRRRHVTNMETSNQSIHIAGDDVLRTSKGDYSTTTRVTLMTNERVLTFPCLENFTNEKWTPVEHEYIMTGSTVFLAKSQIQMTAPLTLTITVELIGDQSASFTAF